MFYFLVHLTNILIVTVTVSSDVYNDKYRSTPFYRDIRNFKAWDTSLTYILTLPYLIYIVCFRLTSIYDHPLILSLYIISMFLFPRSKILLFSFFFSLYIHRMWMLYHVLIYNSSLWSTCSQIYELVFAFNAFSN